MLVGCKTKRLTVEKAFEKEREAYAKHFDSVVKQSIKNELQWVKNESLSTKNLVLQSVAVLDSSGVRQPFHYKHYVDGNLKEEIYLQGGEIAKKEAAKQTATTEQKSEFKTENTRVDVDVGAKKATENTSKSKEKEAKTTGFQFGFYAWLFAIVIVILILRWIANKLKLPFAIKEVKKPPDI
jgi:cobalamin biosynthesis Mg chelatase CobN